MNTYTIIMSLKIMLNILNYVVIPVSLVVLGISTFLILKEICNKCEILKLCK